MLEQQRIEARTSPVTLITRSAATNVPATYGSALNPLMPDR